MSKGVLDKNIIRTLVRRGIIETEIHLRTSPSIYVDFSSALSNAIRENEFGPFVAPHSARELMEEKALAFLSHDKMSGVAVWPDGNIGAVFRNKNSKAGIATPELLLTALFYGGYKLDCFNGRLAKFYGDAGFIPVSRVLFDPEYAPTGWNSAWGNPDVIFWKHNGDAPLVVAEHYGDYARITDGDIRKLPVLPTYEEAFTYRDSLISTCNNF